MSASLARGKVVSVDPLAALRDRFLPRIGAAIVYLSLIAVAVIGLPYYRLDMADRVRSPLHALYRPSGLIGQALGIVSLTFFLFLWLYPLRKRFRRLAFTGTIAKWLASHIVVGLAIPLVAGLHAGWRFRGLAGLSYAAMTVVVLSGIIGKYIYSRIPRSRSGLELSLDEIRVKSDDTLNRIQAATGLSRDRVRDALGLAAPGAGQTGRRKTFSLLIAGDLQRGRILRRLREEWGGQAAAGHPLDHDTLSEALRLARQQIALEQQVSLLEGTQAIFRFWHAAHRPVAITAFLAVTIHVVVVIVMGMTWFH